MKARDGKIWTCPRARPVWTCCEAGLVTNIQARFFSGPRRTSLCGIGPEAGLVQCIPRDARGSAQTSSLLTLELSPTNKAKRNGNLFRLLFRRVQRRLLSASFLIWTVNFDLSQLRHACSSYPRLIKEESLLGFIFFLHLLFSHDSRTMDSGN